MWKNFICFVLLSALTNGEEQTTVQNVTEATTLPVTTSSNVTAEAQTTIASTSSNSTANSTVITTTDGAFSTMPSEQTTGTENSTMLTSTETSSTTKARKCGSVTDTTVCTYEGTNDVCDICVGVECPNGKVCSKAKDECKSECVCANSWETLNEKNECISICTPNPCKNNGTCTPSTSREEGYKCTCTNEYEGDTCEKVRNLCLAQQPSFCPKGSFQCEMHENSTFTCICARGFWLNETSNECIRVDQTTTIAMHFIETPYSEIYNNESYPEAIYAKKMVKTAMEALFTDRLISIVFHKFTQGSLVANFEMNLKVAENETLKDNEQAFRQYILDCSFEDATVENEKCFGTLGKVFLPEKAWTSQDERCESVACPANTECEPVSDSSKLTRCVCVSGFEGYGSLVDTLGTVVEQCKDIDECSLNSTICQNGQECFNEVGSYYCANPCENVKCPGQASCVVQGSSFACECSWIYAGSACSFPWTLIFLITTLIFLITAIGCAVFLVKTLRGSRVGSTNW